VHEKYQNHRRTAQSAIVSVKRAPQGSASSRNNFALVIACVERIAPLHTEQYTLRSSYTPSKAHSRSNGKATARCRIKRAIDSEMLPRRIITAN
jgi:hypothetical protein